jgi:hypothetical protein
MLEWVLWWNLDSGVKGNVMRRRNGTRFMKGTFGREGPEEERRKEDVGLRTML